MLAIWLREAHQHGDAGELLEIAIQDGPVHLLHPLRHGLLDAFLPAMTLHLS